jgi:hypothetical protein
VCSSGWTGVKSPWSSKPAMPCQPRRGSTDPAAWVRSRCRIGRHTAAGRLNLHADFGVVCQQSGPATSLTLSYHRYGLATPSRVCLGPAMPTAPTRTTRDRAVTLVHRHPPPDQHQRRRPQPRCRYRWPWTASPPSATSAPSLPPAGWPATTRQAAQVRHRGARQSARRLTALRPRCSPADFEAK